MNSVQFTRLIKSLSYEKLTKSAESYLNGSDINKFILSVYVNKTIKVKPFNYIEYADMYMSEENEYSKDGLMLRQMFLDSTKTIEKEFNKNRKLCRLFKDLYVSNKSALMKGILNDDIMQSLVKVFFLDEETLQRVGVNLDDADMVDLLADKKVIDVLKKYIICLVGIDIVLNSDLDSDFVTLAVTTDGDKFLDVVYTFIVDNYKSIK